MGPAPAERTLAVIIPSGHKQPYAYCLNSRSVFYYGTGPATLPVAEQKRNIAQVSELVGERSMIMGDKSPKAVRKQATQKQAKAANANLKKQQAVAAKRAANIMK